MLVIVSRLLISVADPTQALSHDYHCFIETLRSSALLISKSSHKGNESIKIFASLVILQSLLLHLHSLVRVNAIVSVCLLFAGFSRKQA